MTVTAAALIAVGLAVCLIMTNPSRPQPAAAGSAATAVTDSQQTHTPASPRKSSAPSPSAVSTSPSASPSVGTTAPKPSPSASAVPPSDTPRKAPVTTSLAGRIRPQVIYPGVATVYKAGVGDGACSYGPSSDMMIAAMNTTDYEVSRACGAYVRVHAANGASVTVRITNECPLPCAPGQLDLSEQAFAELAPVSTGRLAITWSLVSPDTAGTISIRYKTGSSPYWCAVQAIGHRNPLARLEVRAGGGWRQLARTDYNYFLSPDGYGCGNAIRLTDIYGQQLTINEIALRPGAIQPTQAQFTRH